MGSKESRAKGHAPRKLRFWTFCTANGEDQYRRIVAFPSPHRAMQYVIISPMQPNCSARLRSLLYDYQIDFFSARSTFLTISAFSLSRDLGSSIVPTILITVYIS